MSISVEDRISPSDLYVPEEVRESLLAMLPASPVVRKPVRILTPQLMHDREYIAINSQRGLKTRMRMNIIHALA